MQLVRLAAGMGGLFGVTMVLLVTQMAANTTALVA